MFVHERHFVMRRHGTLLILSHKKEEKKGNLSDLWTVLPSWTDRPRPRNVTLGTRISEKKIGKREWGENLSYSSFFFSSFGPPSSFRQRVKEKEEWEISPDYTTTLHLFPVTELGGKTLEFLFNFSGPTAYSNKLIFFSWCICLDIWETGALEEHYFELNLGCVSWLNGKGGEFKVFLKKCNSWFFFHLPGVDRASFPANKRYFIFPECAFFCSHDFRRAFQTRCGFFLLS